MPNYIRPQGGDARRTKKHKEQNERRRTVVYKSERGKRLDDRELAEEGKLLAVAVMKPEARKTSRRCLFGKKTLISRVDRGTGEG